MKEFTDSCGLDSLMLSVYVEKINTLVRVGAVLGAVLWAVTRLFPTGEPPSSAEQLLDTLLAAGEIDPDAYRHVRDELVGAGRH